MPDLKTYQRADFPPVLKWQAIAFMRMEWASIFTGPLRFMTEIYPPDMNPVHFALAEGEALISYATVMHLELDHVGQRYRVGGFGNMFTFPPYRGEGFGRRILQRATNYLRQSQCDVAGLFCDPKLVPFYAAGGWSVTPSATHVGSPDHYETYEPTRMMLFISDKGRQKQADFETEPVYVDWPW